MITQTYTVFTTSTINFILCREKDGFGKLPNICADIGLNTSKQIAANGVVPVAVPTSSAPNTSPGPHASISPQSLAEKPHQSPPSQSSPPQPKSPMPPAASLSKASNSILEEADAQVPSTGVSPTAIGSSLKPTAQESLGQESPQTTSSSIPLPPPEVEATLTKLTAHANVFGVLVLSRPEALVIRSGGAYFEPSGPGAHDRANRLKSVVDLVRNVVVGLEADVPKVETDVSEG